MLLVVEFCRQQTLRASGLTESTCAGLSSFPTAQIVQVPHTSGLLSAPKLRWPSSRTISTDPGISELHDSEAPVVLDLEASQLPTGRQTDRS